MARQHWWQDRPAWFDTLHASEPGLGWIEDEAEARQIVARIAEPYLEGARPSGYFLADAHVADLRARWIEGDAIVPLAQLAERTDRRGLIAWRPTLFADRTRPESLHWALDERMPPIFWVDAGTDAASVRAAFAPYAPGRLPWRPAMYCTARFFVGTEAALDTGIEGLVGWLAQKPLVDGLEWGSAHIDDPWADRVEAGALVIARAAADHSLQAPGAVPSTSVRTALGGSHLKVASFEGFLTVEARYAPAPHGSTLAFLHATYGVPNVPELPIDVAVALFGMRLSNADALFAQLRSADARPARGAYAMALTALLHDDARRLGALLDEPVEGPGLLLAAERGLRRCVHGRVGEVASAVAEGPRAWSGRAGRRSSRRSACGRRRQACPRHRVSRRLPRRRTALRGQDDRADIRWSADHATILPDASQGPG